jgi:hypothetical protein
LRSQESGARRGEEGRVGVLMREKVEIPEGKGVVGGEGGGGRGGEDERSIMLNICIKKLSKNCFFSLI